MSLRSITELPLDRPEQLKALSNETRATILRLLEAQPSSAKIISETLGMTHGKVGHHMKVLREAGLIEVIEERRVRAVTEKIYGLTYERLRWALPASGRLAFTLNQALREAAEDQPFEPPATLFTLRMRRERASEFSRRLAELASEFAESGDTEAAEGFGFVGSVFKTKTP